MLGILKKMIGDSNERDVKKLYKRVEKINALEPQMQALSDEQLRNKTEEFKERLAKGETLDDILYEALRYAVKPAAACMACATMMYS